MINKKLFLVLLVAGSVLLFGCAYNDTPQGEEYITVTDSLSREVKVQKNPARVATLIGSFADVWTLAGGQICAAAEDAWEDFGLDAEGAVNIGGAHSPSLELLLSSSPELVLASASTASNVALLDTLESMRIPVVYFDVDNFDDYLGMLYTCTLITGREDLYQRNGLEIKQKVDRIKAEFTTSALSEEEKRVLVLRVSSTSVKAKGSASTILGELLSDIGCVNIADSDSTLLENLSVESVIRLDPRHIFVVTMGSEQSATENLRHSIIDNSAWQSVSALKEGRIHLMDRRLFNLKPNSRWADSYEKVCSIMLGKD